MDTVRSGYVASISAAIALIISFSLIASPIITIAQESTDPITTSDDADTAASTAETSTTETAPDSSFEDTEAQGNEATNAKQTDEAFVEAFVVDTATSTQGEGGEGNGESGEDATVPGQVLAATSTDGTGGLSDVGGTIETGDAAASTTVNNEINSNITNPDEPGETNSSQITSETTNEGELGSLATSTAETGDNEADGGTGLSTIVTGNAISTASVINVINTNIFNSVGLILFLNQLFGGGFDLRNFDLSYFFDDPADMVSSQNPDCDTAGGCEEECTLLTCLNSSALNVVNTNTATVTNSVIVRASTGQNTASSTGDGGADIDTGDAYAAANVLNLVNTNIINSKYLVVSFNNFGNLVQDITLPAAAFFNVLLGQGGRMPDLNASTFDVQNTNDVDFTGTTTASALTGENTATTGTSTVTDLDIATSTSTSTPGSAVIDTGNAYSMANSYTQANSTQIGGTSMLLLFRVWGGWSGEVVGLPAGLTWMHTPDGIAVMTEDATEEMVNTIGEFNSSSFLASSTNNAVVDNNVDVSAATGQNRAMTENGPATIETGDAYAVANVTNLINTNVVNGNWIFGVFNVFGDWSGDVAFGHPDLSLEAIAVTPEPTVPGSEIEYTFTMENSGDMNADNVTLKTQFDGEHIDIIDIANGVLSGDGASWNLGSIAMGATKEFNVRAKVSNPSNTTFTIPLTAEVSSASTDNDTHDNSKIVTVVVNGPQLPNVPSGGSGGGSGGGFSGAAFGSPAIWTKDPSITISKSSSFSTSTIPATIDYEVVVMNSTTAGPAYTGMLSDVLYDPDGEIVYQRSWNLDTIAPGDEITLTYSVDFASTTKPGAYKNVATVTGIRNYTSIGFGGVAITPVEASSEVEFSASGEVLGATASVPVEAVSETSIACAAYLTSFLARGSRNATQVVKLQRFLNSNIGAELPTTGYFGPMTHASVREFQRRNRIKPTSGNVYTLTTSAINSLMCNGEAPAITIATQPAPAKETTAKVTKPKPVAKKPAPKPAAKVAPIQALAKPVLTQPEPKKGITQWFKSLVPFVSASSR